MCAERSAVFAAIAAGASRISRIAIAVESADAAPSSLMPCGACLQVLAEFMPNDGEVLIAGEGKYKLGDLLPHAFALGPKKRN
jgi:cytidine deaminase